MDIRCHDGGCKRVAPARECAPSITVCLIDSSTLDNATNIIQLVLIWAFNEPKSSGGRIMELP